MSRVAAETREFRVGTCGWTAPDLDDPRIEQLWVAGHYEIMEGALVEMPPSYFAGGEGLANLLFVLKAHARQTALTGRFAAEVDLVLNQDRVVRADAVWLSADDARRQDQAVRAAGRADPIRARIQIPPTLVVESISPGHERRDRVTKRRWYAEFAVPHYWILDVFEKSLECLVLDRGDYRADCSGRDDQRIRPALFPGLEIALPEIWDSQS